MDILLERRFTGLLELSLLTTKEKPTQSILGRTDTLFKDCTLKGFLRGETARKALEAIDHHTHQDAWLLPMTDTPSGLKDLLNVIRDH